MGNEINEVINVLCERLGTTGQYLIPELMKMNVAEDIVLGIISLIIVIVSIHFLPKVWEYDKNNREYSYWAIILILLIIVFSVIFIAILNDTVGWIASPTAKTITYILNSVTAIKQ